MTLSTTLHLTRATIALLAATTAVAASHGRVVPVIVGIVFVFVGCVVHQSVQYALKGGAR